MRTCATILVAAALLLTLPRHADAAPGDAEARQLITQALARQATKAERTKLLARAQALAAKYPKSDAIAYAEGRILSTLGRSRAAIAAYDRALSLNPKFADAHYNAGVVLGRLKQHRAAVKRFIAAGKLNPRLADAFYNAGQAYYDLGEFKKAMAQWRRVLRLEPNSFGIIKKILQCQNALGQFRAAAKTRATLWNIRNTAKDPRLRRMKSVVVDQFKVRGFHVMAFESFDTRGKFAVIYQFKMYKNGRAVASVNLETSSAMVQNGLDSIIVIVRANGRQPTKRMYRKRPAYGALRADVKRMIQRIK